MKIRTNIQFCDLNLEYERYMRCIVLITLFAISQALHNYVVAKK